MEFHDHVVVDVGVEMVKVEIVVVEQNVVEFQIVVVENLEIVVDVADVGVVHRLLVEEQSVVGYQLEEGNLVVVDFVVVVVVEDELHSLVVAYRQNLEMLEAVVASYVVVVVHPFLVQMVNEIVVLVVVVVDCFVLGMTLAGIHGVVVEQIQHFVGVVQIQSLVVVDLQIVVVVDYYFHLVGEIVEDVVVVDVVHDDDD
jgi:hypothetical protein